MVHARVAVDRHVGSDAAEAEMRGVPFCCLVDIGDGDADVVEDEVLVLMRRLGVFSFRLYGSCSAGSRLTGTIFAV